eukprot:98877_1
MPRRRTSRSVCIHRKSKKNNLHKQHASIASGSETKKSYKSLLKKLPIYAKGCHAKTSSQYQLFCVQNIRHLLSFDKSKHPIEPAIDAVIQTGVVPQLIRILRFHNNRTVQYESLWALTNIAAGTTKHTQVLIKHNIIYSLQKVIQSSITDNDTKSQAIWCLGNMVGDSPHMRNKLLMKYNIYYECIAPLFQIKTKIDKDAHWMSLMRESTWTVSNLCRSPSDAIFCTSVNNSLIRLFKTTLCTLSDPEAMSNIFWAINYFIDHNSKKPGNALCKSNIDQMMRGFGDTLIKQKMIDILKTDPSEDRRACRGAIRVIGSIVYLDDLAVNQNQWIHKYLRFKLFKRFNKILRGKDVSEQKEVLWTISNIAADFNQDVVITHALCNPRLMVAIYKILLYGSFAVRKEAAWVVFNMVTQCESLHQIEMAIKLSVIIPALFRLFRFKNESFFSNRFAFAILETMEHLLDLASMLVTAKMFKCSAIDILEAFKEDLKHKTDDTKGKEKERKTDKTEVIVNIEKLNEKLDGILVSMHRQQREEVYLVKCCASKCMKTKYINSDEIRSESANSDETPSSTSSSSMSIVKMNRFYRCRGCGVAMYCSHRCQKWDWKNGHKYKCNNTALL